MWLAGLAGAGEKGRALGGRSVSRVCCLCLPRLCLCLCLCLRLCLCLGLCLRWVVEALHIYHLHRHLLPNFCCNHYLCPPLSRSETEISPSHPYNTPRYSTQRLGQSPLTHKTLPFAHYRLVKTRRNNLAPPCTSDLGTSSAPPLHLDGQTVTQDTSTPSIAFPVPRCMRAA